MVERVQPKGDKHLPSLFHFSLIKLLTLYEINKRKMSWDSFFSTLGLLDHVDISPMEAHEDEPESKETKAYKGKVIAEEVAVPKVVEIVKETRRDKRAKNKEKIKKQVEEAQFIHMPRTRFRDIFSAKKLIDESIPQVDIL